MAELEVADSFRVGEMCAISVLIHAVVAFVGERTAERVGG